jgi:hypothetical protein
MLAFDIVVAVTTTFRVIPIRPFLLNYFNRSIDRFTWVL